MVAWYRDNMFSITLGLYHTLPYLLILVVYSTCHDPELKWRVIGISNFLIFYTISFFAMMSMVISLSSRKQMGGRLLIFSCSVTLERTSDPWPWCWITWKTPISIVCAWLPTQPLTSYVLAAPPTVAFLASSAVRFAFSLRQSGFRCPSFLQ